VLTPDQIGERYGASGGACESKARIGWRARIRTMPDPVRIPNDR
jgi:hypothetical protein